MKTKIALSLSLLLLIDSSVRSNEIASLANDGSQGNQDAREVSDISDDGRFVVFISEATNLVAGDTNGLNDIYVWDRLNGTTERISLAEDGTESDRHCGNPRISGDGRFVTFSTWSRNLVGPVADRNLVGDVHLFDRQTGEMSLLSPNIGPGLSNSPTSLGSVSHDGKVFSFSSDEGMMVKDFNEDPPIYEIVTTRTDGTVIIGEAHARLVLDDDGSVVAFEGGGNVLLEPGEETNGVGDIYVRDRNAGTMERVSIATNGDEANGRSFDPDISGDGRYVVFTSEATNLVPNDTNGQPDVFRHDRQTGETVLVSVAVTGESGDSQSHMPAISRDGRYVSFTTRAGNIIADQNTPFNQPLMVRDMVAGITLMGARSPDGSPSNSVVLESTFSGNGNELSVFSVSTNLLPLEGDQNFRDDIFVVPNPFVDAPDVTAGVRVTVNRSGADAGKPRIGVGIKGKKKGRWFVFAKNTGNTVDGLRLRSSKPKSRLYRYKIFRLTGGRANVTGASYRGGAILADIASGGTITCRVDAKGKGRNGRQRFRYLLNSTRDANAGSSAMINLRTKAKRR